MDMSPAFRKSVSTHAGQAVICYDPFHVVALSVGEGRTNQPDDGAVHGRPAVIPALSNVGGLRRSSTQSGEPIARR